MIEQADLEIVGRHLLHLGAGNHRDNMTRLRRFDHHCSMELAEEDFLGLVFLQNDEVLQIAPRGRNRTLRAVAERAITQGEARLSENWDLGENLRRMRKSLADGNVPREPLVICEASDGEQQYGLFYLQDGAHRALAFATLILLNETHYAPLLAFCSLSAPMWNRLAQA
ncbi:MAG: hypothetical protein ABSD67_25830 [Terracidiphilus sp.]|jgi:hypothetical protein